MDTTTRRVNESAGMLLVGDGVLGLMYPRDHCMLWHGGPAWWRSSIEWFAAHPQVTRAFAGVELATGLWLARRQERRALRRRSSSMGEVTTSSTGGRTSA